MIQQEVWGSVEGQTVTRYTITNSNGARLVLSSFGAAILEIWVPDRDGQLADVVVGLADLAAFQENGPYFGVTVGRYAGRIRDSRFEIDGTEYSVFANWPGGHSLHGGSARFSHRPWASEVLEDAVRFTIESPDGDGGNPGNLTFHATIGLSESNEVFLRYEASTDAPAALNPTNHTYFNLGGHASGPISGHSLRVRASQYAEADENLMATGVLLSVEGTPWDFRSEANLGDRIAAVGGTPAGFDGSFALDGVDGSLREAGVLRDPASGRTLTVRTTETCLHIYTGNFLDGSLVGKEGVAYGPHAAICLETQHLPGSIGVPTWPSTVIRPGDPWSQETRFAFGVE